MVAGEYADWTGALAGAIRHREALTARQVLESGPPVEAALDTLGALAARDQSGSELATEHRAIDEQLHDVVVVKVLAENHSLNPEIRERFTTPREALARRRSATCLRHLPPPSRPVGGGGGAGQRRGVASAGTSSPARTGPGGVPSPKGRPPRSSRWCGLSQESSSGPVGTIWLGLMSVCTT